MSSNLTSSAIDTFPNIKMRSLKASFLLIPLIVVACATQSGTWFKPDITTLQFNQDNYACLQESQQPYGYGQSGFGWAYGWGPGWGGYNGYSGVQTNPELYSACMKARGYIWQPVNTPSQ